MPCAVVDRQIGTIQIDNLPTDELFVDPQFYVSLKNNALWLVMFLLAPPMGWRLRFW